MKHAINLIVLLVLFSLNSCAQNLPKGTGQRIISSSVAIFNSSHNKVKILLGKSSQLVEFEINENETWISPVFTFKPIIKIQTQNKVVSYKLTLGNYYQIFFNEKKQYYDLKKINEKP